MKEILLDGSYMDESGDIVLPEDGQRLSRDGDEIDWDMVADSQLSLVSDQESTKQDEAIEEYVDKRGCSYEMARFALGLDNAENEPRSPGKGKTPTTSRTRKPFKGYNEGSDSELDPYWQGGAHTRRRSPEEQAEVSAMTSAMRQRSVDRQFTEARTKAGQNLVLARDRARKERKGTA